MEELSSVNLLKNLDWLETDISTLLGSFVYGEGMTAADTMMHSAIDFIFRMKVEMSRNSYPSIEL
jgi:glutathione S-transferase